MLWGPLFGQGSRLNLKIRTQHHNQHQGCRGVLEGAKENILICTGYHQAHQIHHFQSQRQWGNWPVPSSILRPFFWVVVPDGLPPRPTINSEHQPTTIQCPHSWLALPITMVGIIGLSQWPQIQPHSTHLHARIQANRWRQTPSLGPKLITFKLKCMKSLFLCILSTHICMKLEGILTMNRKGKFINFFLSSIKAYFPSAAYVAQKVQDCGLYVGRCGGTSVCGPF